MANRLMKIFSLSHIIRELQIKKHNEITSSSVRMIIFKRDTNIGEGVKKREPSCIVGGNVNGCNHLENGIVFPQEAKDRAAR